MNTIYRNEINEPSNSMASEMDFNDNEFDNSRKDAPSGIELTTVKVSSLVYLFLFYLK